MRRKQQKKRYPSLVASAYHDHLNSFTETQQRLTYGALMSRYNSLQTFCFFEFFDNKSQREVANCV